MAAGGFDILPVAIQAVNEIAFIDPQIGRQPAVAAINVNNQSTLDAGLLKNFSARLAMSFKE